jgi:hypothetical protein
MPIFVPPALYYGGVAALGAGGRFLNSPTGQNVIRSGQNLFSRGLAGLQNYANPLINRAFGTQMGVPIQQQVIPKASSAVAPAFLSMYADNPSALITDAGYFSGADDASKLITGEGESGVIEDVYTAGAEIIDAILEDTEKEKKDKKDKKKKKETKENKEPSIDDLPLDAEEAKKKKNLKKGGHVKKQRKRKPYKSSGFVKMKKTKKRKYI